MKKTAVIIPKTLLFVGIFLLSGCSGLRPEDVTKKVLAREISFVGFIEAIQGNRWVVSGQTVIVDPFVHTGSQVGVGDFVRVEGVVGEDGSVVINRIEAFSLVTALPTTLMIILALLVLGIPLTARAMLRATSASSITAVRR